MGEQPTADELRETAEQLLDKADELEAGNDLPSPSSEEISGHGELRADPELTGVLCDMVIGTLYRGVVDGEPAAYVEDGDGNWFTFGSSHTVEAGEAMAALADE